MKCTDAELTEEQRTPCYKAWTEYRDLMESIGGSADIASFRAGFMSGWEAKPDDR